MERVSHHLLLILQSHLPGVAVAIGKLGTQYLHSIELLLAGLYILRHCSSEYQVLALKARWHSLDRWESGCQSIILLSNVSQFLLTPLEGVEVFEDAAGNLQA